MIYSFPGKCLDEAQSYELLETTQSWLVVLRAVQVHTCSLIKMISDGDHVEFLVAVVPCAFPYLKLEPILAPWLLAFTAGAPGSRWW
jgi:hypothetical protein